MSGGMGWVVIGLLLGALGVLISFTGNSVGILLAIFGSILFTIGLSWAVADWRIAVYHREPSESYETDTSSDASTSRLGMWNDGEPSEDDETDTGGSKEQFPSDNTEYVINIDD